MSGEDVGDLKRVDKETEKGIDELLESGSDEETDQEKGVRAGEGENLEKGGEEGGNPGQGGEGDAAAAPGEEEGRPTRDANKPKGLPRFIAANPPNALERKLQVCCIRCRLIKTKAQFYEVGCENCPSLIPKGSQEEVEEYTSKKFDGIISVVDPDDSWARKWVRLNKQIVPGVYAMRCREFLRQ